MKLVQKELAGAWTEVQPKSNAPILYFFKFLCGGVKPIYPSNLPLIWYLCRYRQAGAEVIKSISKFTSKIERASIDEAYIDVTGIIKSI